VSLVRVGSARKEAHLEFEGDSVVHGGRRLQARVALQHANFILKWRCRGRRGSSGGSGRDDVLGCEKRRAGVTAVRVYVYDKSLAHNLRKKIGGGDVTEGEGTRTFGDRSVNAMSSTQLERGSLEDIKVQKL
jgi:hypothetical protein